jgi:hypothetical protein
MNTVISKVLIPNKEWLIKDSGTKIGSIAKNKKGYIFLRKGQVIELNSFKDVVEKLDTTDPKRKVTPEPLNYSIYDYPCSSKPFEPVYNVKKRLPLYAKSSKSKSQYCAGYYVIRFSKGWVKSFCPKLITLDRNLFRGPFETEQEMKNILNIINKP